MFYILYYPSISSTVGVSNTPEGLMSGYQQIIQTENIAIIYRANEGDLFELGSVSNIVEEYGAEKIPIYEVLPKSW